MRRSALRCTTGGGLLPFSKAKRVLVVSKVTRFENEVTKYTSLEDGTGHGGNMEQLRRTHHLHEQYVQTLVAELHKLPHLTDVRVVKCFGALRREHIGRADFIFSLGGDGTFLRTASLIQDLAQAPLLCGINTDPNRSEGYLCAKHNPNSTRDLESFPMGSPEGLGRFLHQLFQGQVQYITRQRLRVSVAPLKGAAGQMHRFLALNDVLLAEREPQKASYYKLHVTEGPQADRTFAERQKSSGLLISTGTGSTAWSRSICSLHPAVVRRILHLIGDGSLPSSVSPDKVADDYNQALNFEPELQTMRFVVRDPIINGVFTCDNLTGFAHSIAVHPRSPGMHIYADGQSSVPLPLGHAADFSIHPEDALTAVQTVHLSS